MAEKILNTRQKQKYDTSTNWTTNNPILLAGELGFESDTNKFKIGNGTSSWNDLSYVSVGGGGGNTILYSTTGQNTDGAMTQKATTDALPQCIEIEMNMQTGQASITVEQFEKLLENQENYIVVNMSLTYSDGSTRTESVKFIRGSYRKEETSSYWVEHLLFNSVNTGDTEKTPYMYLILARHSISPNDIAVTMGGEEYATISQLNEKVDKVNGMGLSTNDYTTADKNKLAGIEAGAEVNPTSLSELSEDATHRLVTDTEKTTWNAKSDFSGSYNDLTDKPTISTINVDGQPQSTINFDSDPQTQIDNIVNNTTKIKTSNGGFSAGNNASATFGGAIGNNASAIVGGAIGNNASAQSGGAVGGAASAGDGGAVGYHTSANYGGAVGYGAKVGNGFAGGYNARAQDTEGNYIDAIQLGTGRNRTEKTLQIYDDNLYNAETHKLGSALLDAIYPVGSIYLSVNNTSPASLFGGSWEALAEGYALWTTTTSGEGGKTISAGLPNITGTTPMLNSLWNYVDATSFNKEFSGAIYSYIAISNGPGPTGSNKCQTRFGFDASKSNSIYGNSAIVQPPAIKIFAWKRIA